MVNIKTKLFTYHYRNSHIFLFMQKVFLFMEKILFIAKGSTLSSIRRADKIM